MATTAKPRTKPPTAAQVNKIAKLRREGATWAEVIEATGVRSNLRPLLAKHGYDSAGVKQGSKQTSKARVLSAAANKKRLASLRANGKAEAQRK